MKLDIWACDSDTCEVWRTYEETAIANIQSELNISAEEAKGRLYQSTIDNPVKLERTKVEFWAEE